LELAALIDDDTDGGDASPTIVSGMTSAAGSAAE
jgi:hypothetical protein